MSPAVCPTPTPPPRGCPQDTTAGSVRFLPVERVRSDYATLRPGSTALPPQDSAALPLRVVATAEGDYQLIDGFKRLRGWRAGGFTQVPVVVECPL